MLLDDVVIGARFRLEADGDAFTALGHPRRVWGRRFDFPVVSDAGERGTVTGSPSDELVTP